MAIRYLPGLPRTAELVVIGGGIVGAATAFHAARAGLRPLVLERRPALCSLTTAVAAGGFRLQLETREQLELVRESAELFLHFAEATGQRGYDPAVRQQGYLWLTTTAEGAERQRRLVERQRAWGVGDVDLLDGDEARRAFPFLAKEVVQARFRAADGLLDPKAVTMGLVAASDAGVVVGCGVVGLRLRGGSVIEVETTLGKVAAGAVVVAAGPFSGEVARLAGVALPVTAVRRQKLVMPEVPQVPADAPMTIDDDTGVHWRPAFRGASLLFAEPDTPPSPPSEHVPLDHRFAFRLLDPASPVSASRVTPFWREVWAAWSAPWMLQAGHYTMTPDHRPLIGPTEVEGLLVNSGYSGRGVMAGPAGARRLVDLLTGKLDPAANPLRPDRPFDAEPAVDIWGGGRLGEAEVAGFVVLDDAGAGGAVPAGLELGPALDVLEGVAVAGALGAPLGEQAQRAGQLPTGGAQLVGEPGRALGVWLADHQPPALQLFEALREDVGGDPRQLIGQVVEAPGALQQRFHDQQRPAVAHAGDRLLQRRAWRPVVHPVLARLRHGVIVR